MAPIGPTNFSKFLQLAWSRVSYVILIIQYDSYVRGVL